MRKLLRSKIAISLSLLLIIFLTGVFGYKFISGYTWVDSFYMTVNTITTVGYGTVSQLSPVENRVKEPGFKDTVIFVTISGRSTHIIELNKKTKNLLRQVKGTNLVCLYLAPLPWPRFVPVLG